MNRLYRKKSLRVLLVSAVVAVCFYQLAVWVHVQLYVSFGSYRRSNLPNASAKTVFAVARKSLRGNSSAIYEVFADCYREMKRRPEEFRAYLEKAEMSEPEMAEFKEAVWASYACYEMEEAAPREQHRQVKETIFGPSDSPVLGP